MNSPDGHKDSRKATLAEPTVGRRSGEGDAGFDEAPGLGLRPALYAGFRDLARLRHDYPLVLIDGERAAACVRPLSDLLDGVRREVAPPGAPGERLRRDVLRIEDEMRTLVARGAEATLAQLWDAAAGQRLARADAAHAEGLDRARRLLPGGDRIIDCTPAAPMVVLTHLWTAAERAKERAFVERIGGLALRLAAILKADAMRSPGARSAEGLKGSFGPAFEGAFDLEAMAGILARLPYAPLDEGRRRRVRHALSVLRSQRFIAPAGGRTDGGESAYSFVFESCAEALEAFGRRLPAAVELVKAIAAAELEIDNRYRESRHDLRFARFDEGQLRPEDLAALPSYLILLHPARCDAAERAALLDLLASRLPMKILVQVDDAAWPTPLGGAGPAGAWGPRLAAMAMGLNGAYVLQGASSHLYRLREDIVRGLAYPGPALFSVFSGPAAGEPGSYLVSAAAVESRAFPLFTYDPGAGPDWASRFAVGHNPQVDKDWSVHRLEFEDENLQRVAADVAFTAVDVAASDRLNARRLAVVPRSEWGAGMVAVADYLKLSADQRRGKVPYVWMVDAGDVLHRIAVDDGLVEAGRRAGEAWRSLQELAGIGNSHALRRVEAERRVWEAAKAREVAALQPSPAATAPADRTEAARTTVAQAPPPAAAEAEAPPADEPSIETLRCTTCNECTNLNNKMFAYNENKQAYIADPAAGTFRQLVEAAELCQVAIIHPGKPKNPDEPNLEDLIRRAEPFR